MEAVSLDLRPDGTGQVAFVLGLGGTSREAGRVQQVEWELLLSGRDFAAGLTQATVAPEADPTRVTVAAPIAFGGVGFDARARTVPVGLRGDALVQWPGRQERHGFDFRGRIPVRGAPVF